MKHVACISKKPMCAMANKTIAPSPWLQKFEEFQDGVWNLLESLVGKEVDRPESTPTKMP